MRLRTGNHETAVLIVGAGPAGLVLACELARRNVDCLVAEKDAQLFAGSRGKGLQPRTQEVLEDLGVLDQVRAHGGLYPPIRARDGGQVVFEGRMDPLSEATPDVPHPNLWMLPQWRTGQILSERLAELGGSVTYGTELMSFTQDAEGVTAVLRHGGTENIVRAGYLVGADGGHSMVRRSLGIGFAGQTDEEERMIIADVRLDGVGRDYWQVWTGAGAFQLALCPLAGTDTFQLTAPLVPANPVPHLTTAGMQRVVDGAAGPGQIRITDLTWTSLYRTNIRMAKRFAEGRVFLVGDAAHVHPPAGGQGLNTGIQDSYNLGWKLAGVLGGAPAGLLCSYSEERVPVAAEVLGISTALHSKAAEQQSGAHRRDDPKLRQLNLGYRDSALSIEGRATPGGLLAGDRAPDAPGHDPDRSEVRLFDLIHSGRITLLAFGPAATRLAIGAANAVPRPRLQAVAIRRPAGRGESPGFVDTGGHAHRAYGICDGQDILFAIRPDGYVGLALDASHSAGDEVAGYLARICAR